jgi:hypothetical protein
LDAHWDHEPRSDCFIDNQQFANPVHGEIGNPIESLYDARPHLNPLPRGEDFHLARVLTRQGIFAQSRRSIRERRGNNFSLSPGERAGVRADFFLSPHHIRVHEEVGLLLFSATSFGLPNQTKAFTT